MSPPHCDSSDGDIAATPFESHEPPGGRSPNRWPKMGFFQTRLGRDSAGVLQAARFAAVAALCAAP